MKKVLVCLAVLALATAAFAQATPELNPDNGHNTHGMAIKDWAQPSGQAGAQNLIYHNNGAVIRNARVVLIFWGPEFGPTGAQAAYATAIQAFRASFGTTPEFNVITQYSGADAVSGFGNIAQANLALGTADMFDSTTPPTNVTDATVQSEVQKYLGSHAFDNSTVYEVFIGPSHYSSSGSSTSCGGPSLSYCAYHGNFTFSGHDVKYSIQPWAGCSGCSSFGN